jgi:hypothetical protein
MNSRKNSLKMVVLTLLHDYQGEAFAIPGLIEVVRRKMLIK